MLQSAFSELFSRVEASSRTSSTRFSAELAGIREALEEESRKRGLEDEAFGEAVVAALSKVKAMALECYGLSEP